MTHQYDHEQRTLLEMAKETETLRNGHHHHHHHHHSHVEYKAPEKLTTQLGLFALKKINAMDPTFLRVREARLLQPVCPGVISNFFYGGSAILCSGYAYYVWRGLGWRGFMAPKAVIPFAGLFFIHKVGQVGINWMREGLYSSKRAALVQDYKNKLGEQYLLKVLNPEFRKV